MTATPLGGRVLRERLRLYLIADADLVAPELLPAIVERALRGGVTSVQLRAKRLTTLAQLELARAVRAICAQGDVPFIVNDRVDVALATGAEGAHVGHAGVEDLPVRDARRLLGPAAILGASVASAEEAVRAEREGASYVSAGPMFATETKADAGPPAGERLLRAVRSATSLPLLAIGGITAARVPALVAAGADGICVGAAILRAADPERAAREIAAAALARAGVG